MTVDDFLTRDTQSLLQADQTFYPLKIPIAHPQLRHYINAQEPDLIYYASAHDVYCLNVESKSRSHIYHAPFDCRCTAAGHGWICVAGGEKGSIAIIDLEPSSSGGAADVDGPLPLGLNERPLGGPTPDAPPPKVRVETLTDDIINSITIFKFDADDESPDEEVVAVITSNDTTVRIYSLTLGIEAAVLQLPFQMNHATISPDGEALVAVGDYNQAYFYQRGPMGTSIVKEEETPCSKGANWHILNTAHLHCTDPFGTLGYFTTAWSPSGALCAVGSEAGYVTIFDTELVRTVEYGEEAVVEIVESTRPTRSDGRAGPGAIRSMLFSPGPWDLLIWAEDRGRVVIADIRAGLRVRQVLNLGQSSVGARREEIEDVVTGQPVQVADAIQMLGSEDGILPSNIRALTEAERNLRGSILVSPNFLEMLVTEHRRLQRLDAGLEDDHGALTAEDRQLVDALSRRFGFPRNPASSSATAERARITEPPSVSSLQDFQDRETDGGRSSHAPRRQASVVLSADSSLQPPARPTTIPPHAHRADLSSVGAYFATSPLAYLPPARPRTPPPDAPRSTNSSTPSISSRSASPDDLPLHRRPAVLRALEQYYQANRPMDHPRLQSNTSTNTGPPTSHHPPSSSTTTTTTPQSAPPRRPAVGGTAIRTGPTSHHPLSSSNTTTPQPAPPRRPAALTNASTSSPLSRQRSNPHRASASTSASPPTRSRAASRLSSRPASSQALSDRALELEARARYMTARAGTLPAAGATMGLYSRSQARFDDPTWGEQSAGLAISAAGDVLWCASEKGILECRLDLWGRRFAGVQKFA